MLRSSSHGGQKVEENGSGEWGSSGQIAMLTADKEWYPRVVARSGYLL